ncbi:MAG TPA: maleylacetoacetate isomerase [Bdellovibrionota bacterium]|jgi:maleylacetoacetate isomerase/maleylpyruvate isomerase|nr:maleylacetoacetate isomerase [Bdellovibrionota bacterium]
MTTHATLLPETLELYGYWRSSASWRVRWALELKGALYEYRSVNLLEKRQHSAEFKTLNPNASLPVLVINGKQVIAQSMAIIEWIEETYNLEEAQLFPGDFYRRAKVRELCETINSDTAPLQNLRAQFLHSQNPDERTAWASHWIHRGLEVFDAISKPLRGKWSAGDEVTAADLFLIPQIYNAHRFGVDVKSKFPELQKIFERALQTPECHKASPEQQIDAIK